MVIIGTRGSALALAQTGRVRDRILARVPDEQVSIKVIKTSADRDPKTSIRAASSVGVFVKELEQALQAKEIDLAVHSMKDVPNRIADGLEIASIPEREDPRDALVTRTGALTIQELPPGSIVGTGSLRRHCQLLSLRPDLRILDLRGNVDTRLQKVEGLGFDAVILACAGLNRLGLSSKITAHLDFREMLPAAGQGALALQIRKGDKNVAPLITPLNHEPTALAVAAERAFMRRVGGGCNSPVAVHATADSGIVKLEGLIAAPDGSNMIRDANVGPCTRAEEVAVALADQLLSLGGRIILRSLR
jgi:hydroxymethylbilane synthase